MFKTNIMIVQSSDSSKTLIGLKIRWTLVVSEKQPFTTSVTLLEYKRLFTFIPLLFQYKHVHTLLLFAADITIPGDKWIIGNVDYMGFYRTNYDVEMWQKLSNQLKTDHTVSFTNKCVLFCNFELFVTTAFTLSPMIFEIWKKLKTC